MTALSDKLDVLFRDASLRTGALGDDIHYLLEELRASYGMTALYLLAGALSPAIVAAHQFADNSAPVVEQQQSNIGAVIDSLFSQNIIELPTDYPIHKLDGELFNPLDMDFFVKSKIIDNDNDALSWMPDGRPAYAHSLLSQDDVIKVANWVKDEYVRTASFINDVWLNQIKTTDNLIVDYSRTIDGYKILLKNGPKENFEQKSNGIDGAFLLMEYIETSSRIIVDISVRDEVKWEKTQSDTNKIIGKPVGAGFYISGSKSGDDVHVQFYEPNKPDIVKYSTEDEFNKVLQCFQDKHGQTVYRVLLPCQGYSFKPTQEYAQTLWSIPDRLQLLK